MSLTLLLPQSSSAFRSLVGVSFDEVVRWLDDRLSQQVAVTVRGPSGHLGNTGATLRGALAPGTGSFGLVDSRGGRVKNWCVGMSGRFYVVEGDLRDVSVVEGMLIIETPEVQVLVSVED